MKPERFKTNTIRAGYFILVLLCLSFFSCSDKEDDNGLVHPSVLPDLSGLSWVEDDLFIGVHDAKNNDEKKNWPRVSLIQLPLSETEGVIWKPLYPDFPGPGGASSDLESSCSIPGTKDFLFVESGQEGANYSRIFHASYINGKVVINSYANWPVEITNVEGTEVCQVGQQLVFLYAERAEGEPSTNIRWANLFINPLDFGDFQEVTFEGIDPVGPGVRPVVALEIDSDGFIYIASAYDSGSDDGPYRSVVWLIGQVLADNEGYATVELGNYQRLGTLDGLKVESIAVRELPGEAKQVFVGTDDEHYGGLIRLLP